MAPQLFELTSARNVVFRGLVFESCRASAIRMKDCADCLGAWVYDKKVTLSGKVAHAAVRAAALNEERLREA